MADSKKYGLIIKKSKPAQQVKKAAIFGNESSDEEESAHKAVNMSLMKEAEKKKQMKQTQNEIRKALEEDPTVYEYDNVYDEMAEKKKAAHVKVPERDKKPKYIEGLLKSAAFRKREFERSVERQVQKEREKEGDEFHDKDAFVTEAYKKKMLEQAEEEKRLQKQEALDAANDVTKQSDLSMFYRNLLNKNVSTGGEYSVGNKKSEAKEVEKKDEHQDRNQKHKEPRTDRQDREDHRHRERHRDRDNRDEDYDKHGSRKRESVKENKRYQETDGGSRRQERSDNDQHPRSSEHSKRLHQDTSSDRQDKNEEDEYRGAKEEESERVQAKRESDKVKTKKGCEAQANVPETKTKFAKRSTQETVMSARDRYLARKRGRENAKAMSANTEED